MAASISPYEPADRDLLRAFQREHFGRDARQGAAGWFEWLYQRNPHRRADAPVLWTCKRDGVIVGQQGRLPVVLHSSGVELDASWGIDLMVHPEWRLKGVGPALFAEFERSCDILLGLGLSGAAQRTCLRAGWTDLGMLPIYARPLDLDACRAALADRAGLLAALPCSLGTGTARARAALTRLNGYSIERIHAFDERVDGLWTSVAREYRVLVKRDFRALRWRFDEIPASDRYERYYLWRRGRLAGCAVLASETWRGLRATRVVDALCERRSIGALLALLVDAARSQSLAALFLEQLGAPSRGSLLALGCVPAGAATRFMVKASGAHAEVLTQEASWLVTRADSDSDLMASA